MNITVYTMKNIHKRNSYIRLNQISDNLQMYIQTQLQKDNISLIDIQKDDYIINYEIFSKEGENKYILSNKKLRYIKDNHSIILNTKNSFYTKDDKGRYIKYDEKSDGNNIVAENIKLINVKRQDKKLYFEIIIFQNNDEKILTFEVKDKGKKDFI